MIRVNHWWTLYPPEKGWMALIFLNLSYVTLQNGSVRTSVYCIRPCVSSQPLTVLIKWWCTSHTRTPPSLSWLTVSVESIAFKEKRKSWFHWSWLMPASSANTAHVLLFHSILSRTETQFWPQNDTSIFVCNKSETITWGCNRKPSANNLYFRKISYLPA